jgi:hypothetical protein
MIQLLLQVQPGAEVTLLNGPMEATSDNPLAPSDIKYKIVENGTFFTL